MYKGASKSENFLNMTGSESTRFKKTGDNSELTPPAIDVSYTADIAGGNVVKVNDLVAYRRILATRRQDMQLQCQYINKKLKLTLPHHEFEFLKNKKENLGKEITKLQIELMNVNAQIKDLSITHASAFEAIFVAIAQKTLPAEVFNNIREESHKIVRGREASKRAQNHEQILQAAYETNYKKY